MHADSTSKLHRLVLSALLVILPISSSLCIDMYLPSYPEIAKNFAITTGVVNLSMSVYLIGLAFGQLVYGPLSDRFGRKKLLLLGLALFSLASFSCFLTPSFAVFLVARFIQAIGACSCIVLARAIVADIFHPEKRTKILALISASNIFSPALAPLLGGYIATCYDWRGIFLAITVFGLLMLLGIGFCLKETLLNFDREALHLGRMVTNAGRLFRNRTFISYLICIGLLSAMVFVWVTYAPEVLVTTFGIPANRFGLFFLVPALGSTAGALFTAKFTSRFGERRLITIGVVAILFGTGLLWIQSVGWFKATPLTILISIMFAFFGTGTSVPQLISGAIAPFVDIAGFTSGIIGFVQTTSSSFSGVVTSSNYNTGYKTMGYLMLVLSILAACSVTPNLLKKTLSLVKYIPQRGRKKEKESDSL